MMGWLSELHFIRPVWLLALALLAPLLWIGIRSQRSAGAWRRVCDAHLLSHVITQGGGRARHGALALMTAGWIATCLALAGPAWERLPQPAYRAPAERVFVLNLSRSMDASDVQPSRLARARYELGDALDTLADGQAGLVIFAEEPYVVTPISDDPDIVASFLPVLETSLMPGRGARLDRAIDEARDLLAQTGASNGGIVVVSDGPGDRPDAAVEAARIASRVGFPVSVLAVGPESATTRSRIDLSALETIADAGGGRLATLSPGDDDIATVLNLSGGVFDPGQEIVDTGHVADVWKDMGIALVWLVVLLAALAFRRGWATALALGVVIGAAALPAEPAAAGVRDWMWRPDQLGADAFEEGRHDQASELFEEPAWRAAALYREGRFQEAAAILGERESAEDRYNLGNALAQAGQLEQAIAAYDQALAQDPANDDAQHNRDLVAKLLEKQDQQQQEQQQEGQQQQDSEDGSSSESSGDSGDSEAGDTAGDSDAAGSANSDQDGGQGDSSGEEPASANDASGDDSNSDPGGSDEPGSESQLGESRSESESQDAASSASQPAAEAAEPGPDDEASASTPAGADPQHADASDARAGARPGAPTEPAADPATARAPASSMADQPLSEREQAVEQWLSRVSDDPGGLLREKLRRRYAMQRYLEATEGGIR